MVVCYSTTFDMDPTEPAVRFKESLLASWICDMVASDYSIAHGNAINFGYLREVIII